MKVDVIAIGKKERSIYDPLYQDLGKMISRFAKLEEHELFPKEVARAHTISPEASQSAYKKTLAPFQDKGFSIALHPAGKIIDSFEFSKLLSDKMSVQFFIGGAYGFDEGFLGTCDRVVSLGALTMSHKIAKAVLLEQIYRGFSILHNHPYHK